MFKIATWNVNSLRVRLPHVLTWLQTEQPDVLALQETKLQNDDFPTNAIEEAGYSVVASGQRAYNGVAILSRDKSADILLDFPGVDDPQRRILGLTIGELRILNLYVPNGEHVLSQKYEYKLNWLNHLTDLLQSEVKKHPRMVILGDFNIAPEEVDVHNPKRWEGNVLFSEPERLAFRNLLKVGFHDCFRIHSSTGRHFSWWDYRLNAFTKDMGLRIDHILATERLSGDCSKCYIDRAPRGWERPSDHAPVIAEFAFNK